MTIDFGAGKPILITLEGKPDAIAFHQLNGTVDFATGDRIDHPDRALMTELGSLRFTSVSSINVVITALLQLRTAMQPPTISLN